MVSMGMRSKEWTMGKLPHPAKHVSLSNCFHADFSNSGSIEPGHSLMDENSIMALSNRTICQKY